jgi:MFS superfamily sulfate permease-like transporter
MAYATVAGLPVEIGLYTCMMPMVVYALLGGNGQLEAQGVTLWAAALPSRASTILQRTPAWQYWSTSGRIHPSVSGALAAYEARPT